jgi:peptidoglycan-associated lipoprotein
MKKLFVFLIINVFVASFLVNGQNKKLQRAETTFKAGEFFQAINLYKDSYNSVSDKQKKAEILFNIGECYRKINMPQKAEIWYAKAVTKEYKDPLVYYYLGQMKMMSQKYDEAKEAFTKFKTAAPSDKRAGDALVACDMAQKWTENPNGYIIENVKFVNSKEDDFSPCYARAEYDELYFTSFRKGAKGKAVHKVTGQSFGDIFETKLDKKGKWSTPVPFSENVNTEFDEGLPNISKDFKTLYYTSCPENAKKQAICHIYSSSKSGEDWNKGKMLQIVGDSIDVGCPAISPDELTLYFVSDMPGTLGGKDIWMVTRAGKSEAWSKPINIGSDINTEGDEMFPYVHPDGTLYFSSNGRIGLGGLDIFKARKNEDGSWKVENMGSPINSPADDFGIIFQANEEKGYFSSSRNQRGDDDIYFFMLPPLKYNLFGVVKDEKTDEPLGNATVKSIGSDGITIETKTDKDGSFKFMLKPTTDYVFIVTKEGFLNGKERETTKGLDKSKDFRTTVLLSSIAKPIELPNIFYDFAKWNLRPESMVALDKLVETLNDNPSITIELMSHTDSRGSDADNLILSQKRAQSVVDYLISKSISADRLVAKGYGESQPKLVDKKLAQQYLFLPENTVLDDKFIEQLPSSDLQEIAHQINRRTEFKVLSIDYKSSKK